MLIVLLGVAIAAILSLSHMSHEWVQPLFGVDIDEADLPPHIQQWSRLGARVNIFGHSVFYRHFTFQGADPNAPTVVLLHGYPSSSFDFSAVRIPFAIPCDLLSLIKFIDILNPWQVADKLTSVAHVFTHDHVGFGLSAKPFENFTYSIFEHADVALRLYLDVLGPARPLILIGHDMADTIVLEIITRRWRGLLPAGLNIIGILLTNGNMRMELANLRLSQQVMMSSWGAFFVGLFSRFDTQSAMSRQQLNEIWSPTYSDTNKRHQDISDLIWLIRLNGGHKVSFFHLFLNIVNYVSFCELYLSLSLQLAHKTIRYLQDRLEFEYRWFAALARLNLPCSIVWGASDAVAPLAVAQYVHSQVHSHPLHCFFSSFTHTYSQAIIPSSQMMIMCFIRLVGITMCLDHSPWRGSFFDARSPRPMGATGSRVYRNSLGAGRPVILKL